MFLHHTPYRPAVAWLLSAFIMLLLAGCGNGVGTAAVPAPTPSSGSYTFNDPGAASDSIQRAPVLGIVVNRQGQVIAVEANSAAAQAGIMVGDTIATVEGQPFAATLAASTQANLMDVPLVQTVRSQIAQGKRMQVTLVRGGQQQTLDVQPAGRAGQPGQATPTPVPADQLYM